MKKFMIAALAAGMLTACSDSAVVETPAGGGAQWGADGTGYVSLSINLPKTTSAGRANDQFNDGNANEWAVNDAILVLFTQGNTENEGQAKFQAAYQLPVNFKQNGDTDDQITATAKITKRIQAIDGDNNIKALVILNGISSGAFKCGNGVAVDNKDNATLKYKKADGSEADIDQGSTTFSDFQAYTSKISTDAQKGLLMLNAPLTDAQSATGSPTFSGKTVSTLSEIIADNIKNTAAAAAAAPAANIYVERAVAKVTMSTDHTTGTVPGGSGTLDYKILGIALDNTNPTSYLVRNADFITETMMKLRSASPTVQPLTTGYRMIGHETVGNSKPTDGTALYRTYFAKDVNYDTNATLTTSEIISSYDAKWVAPAAVANSPLYCLENTFDVARMDFHNTTRAILKVQIGDGSDHYIMHNWDNAGDTWCNETEMKEKVLANIQAMAVYQGKTISEVKLKPTDSGVENVLVLESYKVDDTETTSGTNFNTAKNRIGDVYKYVDGIAYYEVRIQHFGDDLTPWNNGEFTVGNEPKEGSINTIYPTTPDQDGNYLGRYGVLRNNWYNITVNNVKRIGTPFIPAVSGVTTPDDVINSYITVNINILSWAKRDQGVELQ